MLILTRAEGETIVISATASRQVRIGVEALLDVAVHRKEVLERIIGEVASSL